MLMSNGIHNLLELEQMTFNTQYGFMEEVHNGFGVDILLTTEREYMITVSPHTAGRTV